LANVSRRRTSVESIRETLRDGSDSDTLLGTVARSGDVLLLTLVGGEDPAQRDVGKEESKR
jgi:hypothetical protein